MSAPAPVPRGRTRRLPRFLRHRDQLAPQRDTPTRDGADGPDTEGVLRGAAVFAGQCLLIIAFLYVLIWLLNSISLVTITITVAIMLSAILRPIVNQFVGVGVPRPVAAPVVFLVGVGTIVLALWFVGYTISRSMSTITDKVNAAGLFILDWLKTGPVQMSAAQVDKISTDLQSRLTNMTGEILTGTLGAASSLVGVLTGAILCLFSLLFLLLDDGQIWRWAVGLFPAHFQDRVVTGGEVAWRTLVAYMRSTILLAFINAITMVPVMLLAKMELVIPLAVLLFLGSLIPMVGMLAAGGVLMLVALVMQSPLTALVMGIALFIAIQVEGNLLNAYILGKAVSIHPLAILATVTGGTLVGGVFGAFIAVPMVAIISNVIASVRAEGAAEAEFEAREAVEEALQGGLVEAWATPEPPPAAAAGPEGPDHATRT